MTERTVTTSGKGRTATEPDVAEVRLWVAGRHDSSDVAYGRASDLELSVRNELASTSVDEASIRTTDVRLEHRDTAFEVGAADPEYRAETSMTVDCVPETVGEVVRTVTAVGTGTGIEGVRFDVGDAERRRLEEVAVADAMADARRKAETIAAAEGLSVGGVLAVTTETTVGEMNGIVDEALASTSDGFEPNPIEVEESVEVRFELIDA